VVAGSALLPRGRAVYNTSYTFAPDGSLAGATRKVNLVPTMEDALGLSPGDPGELAPVDTPFGKLGTLICYDGFDEAHTGGEPRFCRLAARHDALGCRVIAQPSANPWPWEERWIFAEPGETQLRREQWLNEGLFAQLRRDPPRHVRYVVNPQLLGQVLDNRFDGRSYLFECDAAGPRILAEARRADAVVDAEEVVLRAVEL
jgi:predicted amidohydrolase